MMKAIETLVRSTKSRRVGNHAVWFCGTPQEGDLRFLYIMEGATRVFAYQDTFVCHVDDVRKCVFLTNRGWVTRSTTRALNEYRKYFVDECGYVLVDAEREHYALNALEQDVLSRILSRLDNLEDRDGSARTFADDLFAGSTYSASEATDWVATHFADIKARFEDDGIEGEDVPNPLTDPASCMEEVILRVAYRLARNSAYLRRGIDGEEECDALQYTPETIALIRGELEEALQ